MKYDWIKIVEDQQKSGLSVSKYCKTHKICVSSFYKAKNKLNAEHDEMNTFIPIEVIDHCQSKISMSIDGHTIEFDSLLLDKVIGALK